MASIDAATVSSIVDQTWAEDVLPALTEYVRIPNVSPDYAPEWQAEGHMARAAALLADWCSAREIPGAQVELLERPGLTPLLVVDVPPAGAGGDDETVVLYGHLDKQPEMEGWRAGLGPWEPVIEGDRLYGRGGADDGYSTFAALTALEAVRAAGGSHHRAVVLIEASEESGSCHLPAYLDSLADRLGRPGLVVGLDSGCLTYDRLWVTTSLRGVVAVVVEVAVLTEGVHSGAAGGVVPSSFRVLRRLLDRIEDPATGDMPLPELNVEIPAERTEQMEALAAEFGDAMTRFPVVEGLRPVGSDPADRLARVTWRPSLAVTGMDGFPPVSAAGNVLRPLSRAKLAIRVPPTADAAAAARAVEEALSADPPHGARVSVTVQGAESGWAAPEPEPWLSAALQSASEAAFGRPAGYLGEGGTIPFIGMLGARFPGAQMVVTGVLGPGSNAHGPNEFLHLPAARGVTAAVAHLLDAHTRNG
ncbi:MAG TPA: M20/M25/M40 family metallo-hydrolase [Acidimicrobiales bacterium]|nr:M20/M25/M40 family metallo-hydrolase [Acidimicrobiales bacterium]